MRIAQTVALLIALTSSALAVRWGREAKRISRDLAKRRRSAGQLIIITCYEQRSPIPSQRAASPRATDR